MNDAYSIPKPLYKSVAAALIFSAVLGPVGLLYASFWGGFVMILIGFVVVCSKLLVPIILLWVICCIWGVGAVEAHNRKMMRVLLKQQIATP